MELVYIGNGTYLPDVPARDLNEFEVLKFDINMLLESGLYKIKKEQPKKSKQLETPQGEGE